MKKRGYFLCALTFIALCSSNGYGMYGSSSPVADSWLKMMDLGNDTNEKSIESLTQNIEKQNEQEKKQSEAILWEITKQLAANDTISDIYKYLETVSDFIDDVMIESHNIKTRVNLRNFWESLAKLKITLTELKKAHTAFTTAAETINRYRRGRATKDELQADLQNVQEVLEKAMEAYLAQWPT